VLRAVLHDGAPAATAPPPKRAPVAHTRPGPKLHTVRAGDTLATISASTGVSVARLRQLNPRVEPTSLFIGDRIRLR
jgi:LysM repeat protein